MSIATEIQRLQTAKADIKNAVNNYLGVDNITDETIDGYADKIADLGMPMFLEVGATTVRTSASTTENIASNNHIKIYGDDHNAYTLAEWNAMFVEAGYDKDNMTVEPIGIQCDYLPNKEVYVFDIFNSITWNPVGDSEGNIRQLQHTMYNYTPITGIGTGSDYTTGKNWSVTVNGDNLILYEANTKQSWVIGKELGLVSNSLSSNALNIVDRTYSLWAQTEWMRHRMAISSGISTIKEDGTYGEIQILNLSGVQAAVNEDMYFWVKNDSDVLVNTNKLAKYNLNNRHLINSYSLTQAIADAIYARQKVNGINMNDTGINSSSKPILAYGSKGAEVIAVDGYWMIITPYISQPSLITTTVTNNMADSPAIYWAIQKGYSLPSVYLLYDIARNKTIYDSIITYLSNVEGRSGINTIPANNVIWTCLKISAVSSWGVNLNYGSVSIYGPSAKYYTVGSLIS